MNKHVVNKELSKKLKELGVEQKSIFEWDVDIKGEHFLTLYGRTKLSYHRSKPSYSAFRASELAAFHPDDMIMNKSIVTNTN